MATGSRCKVLLFWGSLLLSLKCAVSGVRADDFLKLLEPVQPNGAKVEGGGKRESAGVGARGGGAEDVARRARELLGLVAKPVEKNPAVKAEPKAEGKEAKPDVPMVLTQDLLQVAIARDLGVRTGVKEGEVRVRVVKDWAPLNIPSSNYFVESFQLQGGGLTSMMAFYIRLISGGLVMGEWPVQARVELFQDVWVAQSRMERGQVVEEDAVSVQRIDVLKERSVPLPSSFKLTGYELAMPVPVGKILCRRDIVEKELVKKGQMVDVMVNQGSLNLRMKAMAVEGGASGMTVKLRNLDSRKEFFGEVTGEGVVSVKLF